MIQQNYLMNLFAKLQTNSNTLETPKSETSANSSTFNFKDILDKTIERPVINRELPRGAESVTKSKVPQENTTGQKPYTRSYREIAKSHKQDSNIDEANTNVKKVESSKSEATGSKKAEKISKAEPKDKDVEKEDVVVQSLAQVLGMNPEDIKKLMAFLNVNPEELSDPSKVQDVVGKLSELIGLNDNQKQALAKVMETAVNKIDELQNAVDSKDTIKAEVSQAKGLGQPAKAVGDKDSESWVKLEGVKLDVVKVSDVPAQFKEIMDKLKVKLEELSQKLEQNPQQTLDEISKGIEDLIAKIDSTGNLPKEAQGKVQDNILEPNKPMKASKIEKKDIKQAEKHENSDDTKDSLDAVQTKDIQSASLSNKEDNTGESSLSNFATPSSETQNAETTNNQTNNTVNFNNVLDNQVQKNSSTNEVEKVQKEVQVDKKQIITQVVEKAKVIFNNSKAEMAMELKPESLGKLSLKVVTENGIVMAKFVAESQQVKEVIESNMQILKDSLEKQGISIQGFSVSVGQDSNRDFQGNRQTSYNENKEGRSSTKSSNIRTSGVIQGAIENSRAINPYEVSDSKINLTA